MFEKNYYEEKLLEIKDLISKENFLAAFDELQAELNMPYIPAIYEDEFKKLYSAVRSSLVDHNKQVMTLSREEVIEMLMSDEEEKQAIALEVISDHNLHPEKVTIKERIQTWNKKKHNLKKAFLFEVLISQKVNVDIQFNEKHLLNPSKVSSVIEHPEVQTLFLEINKLTAKEPTIAEASEQEARRFLLMSYPEIPKCGADLGCKIVKIVKFMFDRESELTEEEASIYRLLNEY